MKTVNSTYSHLNLTIGAYLDFAFISVEVFVCRYVHDIMHRINISGLLQNSMFLWGPVINKDGKLLLNREVFIAQNILCFRILCFIWKPLSCFNVVKCASLHGSLHLTFVCFFSPYVSLPSVQIYSESYNHHRLFSPNICNVMCVSMLTDKMHQAVLMKSNR